MDDCFDYWRAGVFLLDTLRDWQQQKYCAMNAQKSHEQELCYLLEHTWGKGLHAFTSDPKWHMAYLKPGERVIWSRKPSNIACRRSLTVFFKCMVWRISLLHRDNWPQVHCKTPQPVCKQIPDNICYWTRGNTYSHPLPLERKVNANFNHQVYYSLLFLKSFHYKIISYTKSIL